MADCIVVSDTALNDSDKTITIPAGAWRVESIRVEYTATATATNRALAVQYLGRDSDILYVAELATAITPSDVMTMNFSPGAATLAPVDASSEGTQHIPSGVLSNSSIRILDVNAVDAAADDMVVHVILRSV